MSNHIVTLSARYHERGSEIDTTAKLDPRLPAHLPAPRLPAHPPAPPPVHSLQYDVNCTVDIHTTGLASSVRCTS